MLLRDNFIGGDVFFFLMHAFVGKKLYICSVNKEVLWDRLK